jgi:hypothetical protein
MNFGRALGDPLGPATLSGGIMWRNFSTGTSATFDMEARSGMIYWSDPPPPAPPPPPPSPPPPPMPGFCGRPEHRGMQHGDLKGGKEAESAGDCCKACKSLHVAGCAAWVWGSSHGGAAECTLHDAHATPGSKVQPTKWSGYVNATH